MALNEKNSFCRPDRRPFLKKFRRSGIRSRRKKGYLRAYFHRKKARRGWGKAIVATGHKILTIAFQMLRSNTFYDRLNPARAARRLVVRLEALGHQVQLSPAVQHITLAPIVPVVGRGESQTRQPGVSRCEAR